MRELTRTATVAFFVLVTLKDLFLLPISALLIGIAALFAAIGWAFAI